MSLNKPVLDDRSYEQIRDELIARIPIYAPEWTDHNPSDPGIAMLELFSFLTENLLFRFNQIPDATKLEFLRLLQIPLLNAQASKALISLTTKETMGVPVQQGAQASAGDIKFTLQQEINVLPLSLVTVIKTADALPDEDSEEGLFYQQAAASMNAESSITAPYRVETIWQDDPGVAKDIDTTVDGIVWMALLADKASNKEAMREHLINHPKGPVVINIGVVPETQLTDIEDTTSPEFAQRFRCPGEGAEGLGNTVSWQVSTGRFDSDNEPIYQPLGIVGDTSDGLSQEGVARLQLPTEDTQLDVFTLADLNLQGVGDLPPILDDELDERVVCWVRAFRNDDTNIGKLLYVGVNSSQAVQSTKANPEFVGVGNAQANQSYNLNHSQVMANSVILEIEEPQGWAPWQEVETFFASTPSDKHFNVNLATGRLKFGNGINGAVPQIGQRIRVVEYYYGGGIQGNVAPDAITKITASPLVKVSNPLAAYGGSNAETLEQALERIPSEIRSRNRAVTRGDFKELALRTPGAQISRSEILPLYHPQLPFEDSAGVISVVVWPTEDKVNPNAPIPNKNQIKAVCQYLDARRLVTTELYVIPPKYVSVAIAVGVKVKVGFGIDAVRHWVELALRQYLSPLPPYGPNGQGWPLGRRVHGPELEAAAHQVEGVEYLEGLKLVGWDENGETIETTVDLLKNEVPELIGITVESGPVTLEPGDILQPNKPDATPIPVPVIKEVC